MSDLPAIVINTSPILALCATGENLGFLTKLFSRIIVPFEVVVELQAGGRSELGLAEFSQASFLEKRQTPVEIPAFLRKSLGPGEAAVIQTALVENIPLAGIDERVGRRFARLSGVETLGSLGILLKAKKSGFPFLFLNLISRMRERGIWFNESLVQHVLHLSGELPA